MFLFRLFERAIDPVAPPGSHSARWLGAPVPEDPPPHRLLGFYWHFARQARALFGLLFATGLTVALLDLLIPVFIGRVVGMLEAHGPARIWSEAGTTLAAMAAILIFARPTAILGQNLVTQQAIIPAVTAMIRWQSHWQVVRQGWAFFQEDFAGRIANRVMQAGPALRESVVQSVNAVWYILVYGTGAVLVLSATDWRLAIPILVWFALYATLLRLIVPRMRDRSRKASEARSLLTGRVVDSYTNIVTVKLFARAEQEDAWVREALEQLNRDFASQTRLVTLNGFLLSSLNALMLVSTAALAIWLWSRGEVPLATVAAALPMAWQIANISGWVAFNVAGIFENIGVVQEAMGSIAVPRTAPDPPGAKPLAVPRGAIRFEDVRFGYGRVPDGPDAPVRGEDMFKPPLRGAVLHDFDLDIAAGERVGLVGHSGAGKTTAINLLLRFFTPEGGRILVDGQDISRVTQESLRTSIGVVTQDTALLHRSILENIRYGRPDASPAEVVEAAKRAEAHDFIMALSDWRGRTGYDAHVGERGVKLSGGQRQRVAIARVLLKDAPILLLDEATSALDSEVEAAIQASLERLMAGKTVIAVAHRLSTLARMDRLVVLSEGAVAEQGSHAELLAQGGVYARLWQMQSGGFIGA